MDLMRFGPDDGDAVAQYVALQRAAAQVDQPWEPPLTVHRQRMLMLHGYDGEVGTYYLVREGDRAVGTATWDASDYENLDLAWVQVVIDPAYRRSGSGRAAFALLLEECRRAGRPSALLYGWESEATRGFAASVGFVEKAVEVRRVHRLDGSDAQASAFRRLHDEAAVHAADYELLTLGGTTPEELLDGLVAVAGAINDGPLEDLEYEDEVYDAARIRRYEQAQRDAGYRLHRIVARHTDTGQLVGHTVVSVDAEQPAWAEQHDTAVLPEHRGHRLGLLLKSAMALHLSTAEPEVRSVLTENVASNDVMIAVNEALGYQVAGRQLLFQQAVP